MMASFFFLLSCANYCLCYLDLAGITKFKCERKNQKNSGRSSNMTPSCKWPPKSSLLPCSPLVLVGVFNRTCRATVKKIRVATP